MFLLMMFLLFHCKWKIGFTSFRFSKKRALFCSILFLLHSISISLSLFSLLLFLIFVLIVKIHFFARIWPTNDLILFIIEENFFLLWLYFYCNNHCEWLLLIVIWFFHLLFISFFLLLLMFCTSHSHWWNGAVDELFSSLVYFICFFDVNNGRRNDSGWTMKIMVFRVECPQSNQIKNLPTIADNPILGQWINAFALKKVNSEHTKKKWTWHN